MDILEHGPRRTDGLPGNQRYFVASHYSAESSRFVLPLAHGHRYFSLTIQQGPVAGPRDVALRYAALRPGMERKLPHDALLVGDDVDPPLEWYG